jgi:predicted permease
MSTRKRPPRRPDEDFHAEIESHLELEAERLVESGVAPDEAQAAARRTFGNVTAARERFYERRRVLWLDHLRDDLRGALRSLRRHPVATIVAISSLAAGIGAATVTLTVRSVVFYKPPPTYADPSQLSRVQVGRPGRAVDPLGSPVPAPLYVIWSDTLGDSIGGATTGRGDRDVRTDDRTRTVPLRAVTPGLFALLGVSPVLGQPVSDASRTSADSPPAVLSYRAWHELFDARPDAVGRTVWIENRPYTVAAVMPARFWFAEMNSPIWLVVDPRTLTADDMLDVVIRRPRGMTPARLDARLQPGLADYAARQPVGRRQLLLRVSGIEGTPLGHSVAIVLPYVLGTSVLLTLLIACANVAILMIAQWTGREHEIAIRASIGASRGRIIRSMLTESVLVALCGAALGICATLALRGWILRSGGARFFDLSIDWIVFAQTAAIAIAAGIISGMAPAWSETRRLNANPLRALAGSDRVRQRWRHALVVLEITVTVALLVETAALIDGYQRARTADMGFATRPLLTARVENASGVPTTRVLDTLNQLPGVAAAAASTRVPFAGARIQERVALDAAGTNTVVAERGAISPGFFAALGVPMRAGRPFGAGDLPGSRTAIANEALATRLFQGRNPIGEDIWIAETPYDIVGVVADYASNPMRVAADEPRVFLPLAMDAGDVKGIHLLIRAKGEAGPLVQPIRRSLQDLTPGTVVTGANTLDQIITIISQEILVGTAPLFPLIALGMFLTTAGIYGVLAFAITRRARELAVRVAVGATGWHLIRLVTAQSLKLVAAGSAAGIGATFLLSRVVRAYGGAGSVFDPPFHAFVVPVLVVLAIGGLATWIPSRRARRIDPVVVLRT